MPLHPDAGSPARDEHLIDVDALVRAYHDAHPDPTSPAERVAFGTSGHRGTALRSTFNQDHILAICQAIADQRRAAGLDGPLFLGRDTHALSDLALATALEVFAANEVPVRVEATDAPIPTPVISHAILTWNQDPSRGRADGVIITPSHNPPQDGGIKYNPPSGGPADTELTSDVAARANAYLEAGLEGVRRVSVDAARRSPHVTAVDLIAPYARDLGTVLDLERVAAAGVRIGVDPLGGASLHYWGPIAEIHGLALEVVNDAVDPTFRFMRIDHDGKIRMDCSSPHAMAGLIAWKDRFDVAFGNDPDADRHGIVTPSGGLLNPNHYLSVAVEYLFAHRPEWPANAGVGKTLVSSSMIDRVAGELGRPLSEVPVGFKWFVDGLLDGTTAFGGEESAGASFVRRDGTVWTTDKDGLLLGLLAAEITAVTGDDLADRYRRLEERHGCAVYARTDAPADADAKARLKALDASAVKATELAGEPIVAALTRAPGNDAPIGGLKVVTGSGWFAARPSGTEDIYKIYAESFRGEDHLARIQEEAAALVDGVLAG